MNKEELRAKLHNYEERLRDVTDAIKETRKRLEEPDVVALKSGDFGYDCINTRKVLVVKFPKGRLVKLMENGHADCQAASIQDCPFPVLGNVFDMMKDWDKDLDSFKLNEHSRNWATLRLARNGTKISFFIDGYASTVTGLKDAELVQNALGRMIATIKRQNA